MSSKIEVSRDLLEMIYRHKDRMPSGIIEPLRRLLEPQDYAPVVERQPDAFQVISDR